MNFEISVIIPVYNAARYLEKAITSAIEQELVIQVVAVDDGSTDGSHSLLIKLEKIYKKLTVLTHPNHCNKGRSATRNLGINHAIGNFIAFLDADDFYLDNRFLKDLEIFKQRSDADGVYNAVGFKIYDTSKSHLPQVQQLYTVNQVVAPDSLFENLVTGKVGHFQIDGLTVKKALFDRTGLFNEDLEVAEDTDIFWKMAIAGKIYTGEIDKAVALRGVHNFNSFYNDELYAENIYKMYESLISWSSKNKVALNKIDLLLKWVWILKHKKEDGLWNETRLWATQFSGNLRIIFSYLLIKYFPLVRRRKQVFPFLK
ncbi:glycosyltransferase family 2 protein [Leeuwenhoekiella sp. H156]|uniref:glycosyltransferase family 2 protein n=1 Tax=Leeuwenhoekiella sp. H156 TaxID=3450128 RepID=UPI003FA48F8F